jgi:hypothetical protein
MGCLGQDDEMLRFFLCIIEKEKESKNWTSPPFLEARSTSAKDYASTCSSIAREKSGEEKANKIGMDGVHARNDQ